MLETSLRYDRDEDVSARLVGTVIRYQGSPIIVDAVNVRVPLHIIATNCVNKAKYDIHSSDVELDVSSPPLGYANVGLTSAYLSRSPARRFKQGIDPGSLDIFWPKEALKAITKKVDNNRRGDAVADWERLRRREEGGNRRQFPCTLQELGATILNDYPIFDRRLEEGLRAGEYDGRAISRKLSLERVNEKMAAIFHTVNHIGFWFFEGEPYLLPSFNSDYYKGVLLKNNLTR